MAVQLSDARTQLVGMPDGRVPLNVAVPVALTLYPGSPFVTVAVQVSETPTVPGDGKHDRVVVVVVWTTRLVVPELVW